VATALREDDPTRAREVLDELTKRQDPATRDAAALARAQLDWSQGERERARGELERLAAAGATKEIRAQAARSIARFEER
jgi:outer membrane PBP1 activator LpoA protein